MMAKSAFDVFSGPDFHEKPMEGTSTSASSWQEARVPMNRKCMEGSSYFMGSPVDFQTILKVRANALDFSVSLRLKYVRGSAKASIGLPPMREFILCENYSP